MKTYLNDLLKTRLERARVALKEFHEKRGIQATEKPNKGRKRKAADSEHPAQPSQPKEAFVFSESTDTGLIISLKATLELCTYLTTKCKFKYLMTRRLNQDALEVWGEPANNIKGYIL